MPQSISEMQEGVKQGVFKIGSDGMVHLRNNSSGDGFLDPREFLDLNEQETAEHLNISDGEILRLFGASPNSFVAPAWGYRPGVTKKVAGERYSVVADSSQHVESGGCDVLLTGAHDDGNYFHAAETFRPGGRMLTYSNPDFWRCYASAGIPIHYMQHTDTNWEILKNFLRRRSDAAIPSSGRGVRSRLLHFVENTAHSRNLRAICAVLLTIIDSSLEPTSWQFIWNVLTRSSLYEFVRAMKSAGYNCIPLTDLPTRLNNSQFLTTQTKLTVDG